MVSWGSTGGPAGAGPAAAAPASAPVRILYDGECGWCRVSTALLLRLDRNGRLLPLTIQSGEGQELLREVPPAQRLDAAHVVGPDGAITTGGDAAPVVAAQLAGLRHAAPLLRRFRGATGAVYGAVAGNRRRLGRLVSAGAIARADAAIAAHRRRALAPGAGLSRPTRT